MPLSQYEKTQFDRLTAGLGLGDPVTLKEMKKREQTMAYIAFPQITARAGRMMWYALIILGLALIPTAIHCALADAVMLAAVTTAGMALTFGVVVSLAERQW